MLAEHLLNAWPEMDRFLAHTGIHRLRLLFRPDHLEIQLRRGPCCMDAWQRSIGDTVQWSARPPFRDQGIRPFPQEIPWADLMPWLNHVSALAWGSQALMEGGCDGVRVAASGQYRSALPQHQPWRLAAWMIPGLRAGGAGRFLQHTQPKIVAEATACVKGVMPGVYQVSDRSMSAHEALRIKGLKGLYHSPVLGGSFHTYEALEGRQLPLVVHVHPDHVWIRSDRVSEPMFGGVALRWTQKGCFRQYPRGWYGMRPTFLVPLLV